MNRSYSWINVRYAFVAGLLMIFAVSAMAQPRFGLSPEAYAAYNRWMLASCLGGDERSLVDDLRRHAQALSPAFEQAIVEGPTDEEIAALRAAAEQRYAQRATFPLEQFRISGVSRQDLAKFRTVSRQDYVSNQVRRFTTGYRSNAVAALGLIGGSESRALLSRIAESRTDPLAPAAREALKRTR